MHWLLFGFSLLALFGCTNPPYQGKEVLGASEFILDSYKIREGKFSILEMEGKSYQELPNEYLKEYEDLIQDGDVFRIAVYHPSRRDISEAVERIGNTIGYRVEGGKVLLPDLPAITIEGLTLDEARERIEQAYLQEIRDIEVFIAYKDRLERKVELTGLVQVSSLPVDGKMRLYEALATARVPPEANLYKSYLVRGLKPLPVDFNKLLKEGDMLQNVVLRGGDKVYIADKAASNLMVLGEVSKEGIVDLPAGSMPLREALAKAGGIMYTGDKAYIQVIRGNITRPKIYTLNWRHIIRLPTDSMLLMPGDIVYVAATPITEWNRFVSQLFPSFTALDLFCRGYGGLISFK